MRRDVIRLHGLVARAVARHKPDHQASFVQQQRRAVRADLIGPRPVLAVHPDDLLCRRRLGRHELLAVSVWIDKWILEIRHRSHL